MDQDNDKSEETFEETMRESVELSVPVSRERAERFYDRMRGAIRRYVESKGPFAGKTSEYLLLVPDVFMLLWRLMNDARVSAKYRVMLGSGIAYYLFPLDIMPEGFMGPAGYIDDLVFGVYLLNKMLTDTEPAILREHWSGKEDILATIRNVLTAAETLVGTQILGRLKKTLK